MSAFGNPEPWTAQQDQDLRREFAYWDRSPRRLRPGTWSSISRRVGRSAEACRARLAQLSGMAPLPSSPAVPRPRHRSSSSVDGAGGLVAGIRVELGAEPRLEGARWT